MSDSGARPGATVAPGGQYRMPPSVRTAQVLALGLALVGVLATAAAGWLFGPRSALITAFGFVPGWLLGAVALAFGAVGGGIRVGAVALAIVNMAWTVPTISTGHPPGWLGPIVSVALVVALFRRSARDWFVPRHW